MKAILAFAVPVLLAAAQIQMETLFVAGDVVVRFTSDSEGRPPSTGADDVPRLDPFLAEVSREIGCPLALRRVASGGDLLLRLDAPALAARLRGVLGLHPGVQAASVVAADAAEPRVAVQVRLTADAAVVARDASQDLGIPVTERALPEGDHLFEVDTRALTLEVVERLKARDDVDYAQPNYSASR